MAAICDVSEGALAGFGERFSVDAENRYLSLDEMLESEDLDIAVICTWGAFHAEVGIKISESQQVKAILCEKPFTSIAAEAEAFVGAANENGVLVAEAFKFRHHPMHIKAKELIDSGAIGDFMTLRSTFCTGGGGGVLKPVNPKRIGGLTRQRVVVVSTIWRVTISTMHGLCLVLNLFGFQARLKQG